MDSGEKSYKELKDELAELQKAYDSLKLNSIQGMSVLKLAEEKARTSEDKFMKAFFTSPDSVNINRLSDGMYVSVNKGFVNMLGYTEEEVIGKTSIELNIWADPDNRISLIDLVNKNRKVDNFEALFVHKEGRIVIGLMSATIIELEGVPHLLNITKDITDRKQTEEALSREQFFVKSLMDNIPDHVYFKDLESRFIRINKSHAESFGLTDPKDAIGKTDFDFF
jgi:PAS domain S-box-containing protein